jgi:2-oxoisovalerate dehydrogenase E1 component alpha subunit
VRRTGIPVAAAAYGYNCNWLAAGDVLSDSAPFSILNEDGSCAAEHAGLVSDEDLAAVLDLFVLNRILDRRLSMLQRQGRLGFYMTSRGEEATIFATAMALEPSDPIFLSYRELGCLLWRRIPLALIFNQLIGNSQDLCLGRQMPVHYTFREWGIPSVSSPVGTQLPHATGFGYAAKLQKTGQVAVAFCGEGTASQGDFHTALNFAGVFATPSIFVIRNNGYAISTPESVQTAAKSLAARGAGYGVPGHQVDGNDLLAVLFVMREAAARAKAGLGPTLVEAMTYRLGAHSTADDPSAYRTDAETAEWERVDPFARLARHGKWRGVWDEAKEESARADWDKRVTETLAECERHPPPAVESLFEGVLAARGAQLAEQRDEYLAWHRRRPREKFDHVP